MIHVKAILVGIDHIRIFGIGLELVFNGGSCEGVLLKRDKCNLHLKRAPELVSVARYTKNKNIVYSN